jgi:hypothetical protein
MIKRNNPLRWALLAGVTIALTASAQTGKREIKIEGFRQASAVAPVKKAQNSEATAIQVVLAEFGEHDRPLQTGAVKATGTPVYAQEYSVETYDRQFSSFMRSSGIRYGSGEPRSEIKYGSGEPRSDIKYGSGEPRSDIKYGSGERRSEIEYGVTGDARNNIPYGGTAK